MYCTIQPDITSKNTSINSKRLPAIYNRLNWDALRERWTKLTKFNRTPIVLDFGCVVILTTLSIFLLPRVLSSEDMTRSGSLLKKTILLYLRGSVMTLILLSALTFLTLLLIKKQ